MQRKNTANKVLSIVLSIIMALSTMSMLTVTSFAEETRPAQSSGVWNYTTSVLNAARTSFSSNGGNDISMAVADTDFFFMQTEDNQLMTYSTVFYCKKNSRYASIFIVDVTTNQADSNYTGAYVDGSESWALTIGNVNDGGDATPNGDELTGSGMSSVTFTGYTYTASFVANGSAVYHPQWIIRHKNRNNTFTTADYTNPTFNITVVDMRELLELIELAQTRGKDTSAVLSGFDTTGATYYSQAEVDAKADEIAALMCADYTALNAAIANAEALGENSQSLGGKLYDETTYNAMAAVLAEAKAINRYLEDNAENQALLDSKAAELQAAVDNVIRNDFEAISYYVDGELYATVPFAADGGFNFHDVTDHFVADPTKANATFDGWRDADGNRIKPNTPVTSSFSVYAHFAVDTRGAGPVEQFGRYDHAADANYDDGRGANGVTLWVENNNFNFVQTKDDQEFSFNAAVSAVKNDPAKFARVTSVVFRDSNTAFIKDNNLSNDDIEYYCETGNAGAKPADSADGNLPGVTGATYEEQMANSVVRWRYIYTFPAQGEKHYNFDWTIKFKSGNSSSSNSTYTEYVTFNINVTDLREIIQVYAKARSVANNANSPLSPERQAELVALVESIDDNYKFDGTEYYEQTDVDSLVSQLNGYIQGTDFPCDYSRLDAAISAAEVYVNAGNTNNQYIDEVWNDLIAAYQAAGNVERGLYIDNNNVNQPMIDAATEELEYAIEALSYKTHQNPKADTTALEEAVDNAESIINANPDAYTPESIQDLQDAIDAAQDIIDNPPYDNGDGTAQQIIQDAIDAINDALDALTPDKTALEDKIDEGNNTDTTGMTPDSIQALEDAIAAAEDVNNDPDATVEEIQDAIDAINDAINGLKPDKTELEELISIAEAIDTTIIDPAVVQMLDNAINDGETVDADSDATFSDVADAVQNLKDAIDAVLQSVVNDAQSIDTTGMTAISTSRLEDAFADAEDLLNNGGTYQDKVDAINALTDAISNLNADKQELEYAINAGEGIDTTGVPQNLIDALEDALTDGNTVDADSDATVQEVSDATEAIKNAIADILAEIISEAENTDTTGMTDQSISDLGQAITDAQDVLNNPDATAEELADAIADIQNALDNLTPDKTELADAIADGNEIVSGDTSNFTPANVQALEDAITAGETVYNDPDATAQEIKDATDAIRDALANLLTEAIDNAEDIINNNSDDYTLGSVQNLENAVSDAQDVINNPDSTPEEIKNAIEAINDAINNLAPDKTELADAISSGNNVVNGDTSGYTPASVQQLEDAIADGQNVYDDDTATIQEIKDATEAIRDALANLLTEAIDNAEDIVNNSSDDYTLSSIQALEDAISDAQDVINNPDSTPEEIKNAIDDINNAIDNLTPDKTELEAKIDEGHNTDTSAYTSESAADLGDAIAAGEAVYNDPDATVQEIQDAIDAIDAAIAALKPDKSALEQAIIDGQTEADDYKYINDQNMQDLLDVLSDAQDVYNNPDATLQEVNDAIDAINDAVNMLNTKPDLNVTVYDDEGNVITSFDIPYGAEMTFGEISSNLPDDISDYKDHDEIFLGWTDYDGRYYNDTDNFSDPLNADIYLSVQKTVLTENENSDITIDRYSENETDYTYLVGLNPAGTSVEDIVAQLKNRGTEIIVTTADGNSELYGNDLVGTGCLVKCVNALDHSIVYEVATVILYGDVNGDGLVNADDKSLMNADAFFGGSNIEAGTVYYIAGDLEKDGVLDAFDYFYVDGIMTGGRAFDQSSELYK